MPNLRKFPSDSEFLIQLPPFRNEGLEGRRGYVSSAPIGIETADGVDPADPWFPICAIEVNRALAQRYTVEANNGLFCAPNGSGVSVSQATFGMFTEGDLMSRVTVGISLFAPQGAPTNSPDAVNPGLNTVPPQVRFQIRASLAQNIGAPRWQGVLAANSYDGACCLLGKTGGVHATRWELWGYVLSASPSNYGPIVATIQMAVDRLGDVGNRVDNQNQYGPDVSAEAVPP